MVEGLLEEDDTAEVLEGAGGGEEELAESPPVRLVVLHIDARQTLPDRASRLVGGQDSLSGGANVGSIGNQLIFNNKQ